jgi:hypothetical protein
VKRAIFSVALVALTGCAAARARDEALLKRLDEIDRRQVAIEQKLNQGAGAARAATRIDLAVGGQKVLSSAGVTSFATGNDVIQIKSFDDGRQLLLNAVKPGYTGLTLIHGDGKIESYDVRVAADHRD